MFIPRSRVYPKGHPSGAYSRQLLSVVDNKDINDLIDASSNNFNASMNSSSSDVTALIDVLSSALSIGKNGNNVDISAVLTNATVCLTLSNKSICSSECVKNAVMISRKAIIDIAGDDGVLLSP